MKVLFPVWLGKHSGFRVGPLMVAEIVLNQPYNLMQCRLFIPCNFIYSVLGPDVNGSKSMLKLDFEILLSKLVFPSTSCWFVFHPLSDFIVLIYGTI